MRKQKWLMASMIAAATAGCPAEDNEPMPTPLTPTARAVMAYAEASCALAFACCTDAERRGFQLTVDNEADCVGGAYFASGDAIAAAEAAIAAGTGVLDVDTASRCHDALTASIANCAEETLFDRECEGAAHAAFLAPLVDDGEACSVDIECLSGVCVDAACLSLPRLGEACSPGNCAGELLCLDGVCADPVRLDDGGACNADDQCLSSTCDQNSHVCVPFPDVCATSG